MLFQVVLVEVSSMPLTCMYTVRTGTIRTIFMKGQCEARKGWVAGFPRTRLTRGTRTQTQSMKSMRAYVCMLEFGSRTGYRRLSSTIRVRFAMVYRPLPRCAWRLLLGKIDDMCQKRAQLQIFPWPGLSTAGDPMLKNQSGRICTETTRSSKTL
jgi:hypothetical protein